MTIPRLTALLGLALALTMVAGCGDEKSSPQAGGAPNPCALVSTAEAAAALGQPLQEPEIRKTQNPLGQVICFYPAAADDDKVRFVQISLVSTKGMTEQMRQQGYSAARLFQDTKALLTQPQEVPGLGQAAFFGGSGLQAGAGLHVLQGDTYLTVIVASGDADKNLEQAKVLAAKALGKLK